MTAPEPPWAAPLATAPVAGRVAVPGSKSIANRALVLAALAGDGAARAVRGVARSRDGALMVDALRALGAPVEVSPGRDDTVDVAVMAPGRFTGGTVDCGLAGTVMRFLPPLAALAAGPVAFDGDPHARTRPMGAVLDGLRGLGVAVDPPGATTLPVTVSGGPTPPGGEVVVDASGSSQFVSGLLLSGARYARGVAVTHAGDAGVPSLPHVEMTVAMLRAAGADVEVAPDRWRVAPAPLSPPPAFDVEPDLPGATAYLAAALVTAGEVTVAGWPARTGGVDLQPVGAVRDVLEAFGGVVTLDAAGLTVRGPDRLPGVDLDLGAVGELTPTVAALAAAAALGGATSRLRGVGHVRGHETDRLAALAAELTAVGIGVQELPDGLVVSPAAGPARPTRPWRSYADHRMATAGALVGLVVGGLEIDDVATTAKTLPGFAAHWSALVDPAGIPA